MHFIDAVTVAGTRRTADGYLIAEAKCVRTGVQIYGGREVGRPEMDMVRVYRAADQVFALDSLQSFSHAPITIDHPAESVTAANWKELSVGEVSTAAKQDGQWVALPLILKDAKAIQAVESGKRELSAGYQCTLEWTPGVTADGEAYDACQTGIKINHLALVDRARAGSQARIGDGANTWGVAPISPTEKRTVTMSDALRTVVVDGLSVSTTDQGALAITKLQKDAADLRTALADAQKALDTKAGELAALTKKHADEIAARDAKIADAEKNLDSRIEERQAVVASAEKIVGKAIDAKGKTTADIRREAVAAVMGDAAVKDKSADYVLASFDVLAKSSGGTPAARDSLGHLVQQDVQHRQPANAWDSAFASSGIAMKK